MSIDVVIWWKAGFSSSALEDMVDGMMAFPHRHGGMVPTEELP